MPLPTAVPRCSWKRSIAARMSSRLCVGDCTTDAVAANDTTPMRVVFGCSATNARAASCAATMRLGLTSVARMLPETSIARITVSCCDGSVTTGGRARDRDEHQRQRDQEQQRRHVPAEALARAHRVPDEARGSRSAARPSSSAAAARGRRPPPAGPAAAATASRARGTSRVDSRGAAAGRRRWRAGCAACAGRRSAGSRRRDRRPSTSSSASTPAARKAERSSASRRFAAAAKRWRKPAVVRVDEQLLAGLGILDDEQAEIGQLHLQRIVEPHRDHVVALGEVGERLGPARRADEIGDDEHQRAPRRDAIGRAAAARAGRSPPTARARGRVSIRCSRCSTWRRPLRAGITVSTLLP